ncbi:MAG: tRNA (N6-threonylcarbamoyladenosine(37)-N6)-methyltransferase TrmO [Candidatus Cloacimonetes bacterium]|nr:tRNA (N6-threonylcarbamoyladenosine(37)-N6)-methyltransferase TrmO [Candidatus Cloacimonadota bacterium]
MKEITFKPIGIIHSPFKEPVGIPIQPAGAKGIKGNIEIFEEFKEGLKDLDGFSHIVLLFNFHLSEGYKLEVMPFMEDKIRGVFATRAPRRPNQIGMSIVRLEKVEDNILHISNVDIIDGTPLLDIKPFVSKFDCFDINENEKVGWLKKRVKRVDEHRSDERFS